MPTPAPKGTRHTKPVCVRKREGEQESERACVFVCDERAKVSAIRSLRARVRDFV